MATIDFDKLMSSVKATFKEEQTERKDYTDKRVIKVTRDEADNGSLVVRIIPDKNGLGVVKVFRHFAKFEDPKNGSKRYFIRNCPTTIDQKCPYCEAYVEAWKNKDETEIAKLKPGKRNEIYISNVLVVKDPSNPANNGKVMLFEYGFKISKMIEECLNGDEDSEIAPLNIYHPMKGANLLVKHSKQGTNIVLDGTKFLTPSSICKDMEEFEGILERTYDLTEFLDVSKFESYEDLTKDFFKFVHGFEPGESTKTTKPAQTVKLESKDIPWEDEVPETKVASVKTKTPVKVEDDSFFDDL